MVVSAKQFVDLHANADQCESVREKDERKAVIATDRQYATSRAEASSNAPLIGVKIRDCGLVISVQLP
ncbi:hypothetical protein VZT92_010150 [Zoarces viviparus]|uniref:Uncharacterized protein n=1 Tax=Zoarces viviparus TaxID=48416 RepID=A0AAW1FEE8_ZOAVI